MLFQRPCVRLVGVVAVVAAGSGLLGAPWVMAAMASQTAVAQAAPLPAATTVLYLPLVPHSSAASAPPSATAIPTPAPIGTPAPTGTPAPSPTPQPMFGEIDLPSFEKIYSGVNATTSAPQAVMIKNLGGATLTITSASIVGSHASAFAFAQPPQLPLRIAPGASVNMGVVFAPPADLIGSLSAALRIASDDRDEPTRDVGLYGLSTKGEQGENEPTLKKVADTLGFPIDVGGDRLLLSTSSNLIGDEVAAQSFVKAGAGNVTLRPVARYSPDERLPFGYYTNPGAPVTTVLATIATEQEQTLNPAIEAGGASSFDPGSGAFGVFVQSLVFDRNTYTQNNLNTGPVQHAVRVYPLKDRAVQPISNSYLIAFEDNSNGDYQDYVFVITNVQPAP